MTRLELFVRRADGRGFTEATERDDPRGRCAIDKAAFEALTRRGVVSVQVTPADRVGGYRR
jgi:hypothetical protein